MSDNPQPESTENNKAPDDGSPLPPETGESSDKSGEEPQQAGAYSVSPPVQAKVPWLTRHSVAIFYTLFVLTVAVSIGWLGQRVAKSLLPFATAWREKFLDQRASRPRTPGPADPVLQAQAEALLKRLASGDAQAADLILSQSVNWTGKTLRTANTDRDVTTAINFADMHVREAAVAAQLALTGVTQDEDGLKALEGAVGDPRLRPWALWSIGALGNRGVDPVHTAKILGSYLNDPDPYVRSEAVDGLSLLATDETIPMLLDRFRNDPSPVVQEHAACDMSQSGMYSHTQRMQAGASLIRWVDDPLLNAQQHTWTFQALHDITGANLGTAPAAWRSWWSRNSRR